MHVINPVSWKFPLINFSELLYNIAYKVLLELMKPGYYSEKGKAEACNLDPFNVGLPMVSCFLIHTR